MALSAIYYRDAGTGQILGALVFSHWLLDLFAFLISLEVFPRVATYVKGFGLSDSLVRETIVELSMLIVGIIVNKGMRK